MKISKKKLDFLINISDKCFNNSYKSVRKFSPGKDKKQLY